MNMVRRLNHTFTTSLFTIIEANLPILPKKLYKLEEILDKYRKIHSDQQVLLDLYRNSQNMLSLDQDYIKLTDQQSHLYKDLQLLLIKAYKSYDINNHNLILHSNMLYFEEPDKPVTLEIIPGSGGQEAKIFSDQLFQMYYNISKMKGWDLDITGDNRATIKGNKVLKILSYETGIHRVQRIPETEKRGRMQTSSAAVTILPKESVESVTFKESELLIETMRSSGHGGQSVNKSETAVRITHLPTGIAVTMKEASGQIENKTLALKALANKLEEKERKNISLKAMALKCKQTGNLDRSEKIRTFNFEHDRVTDHRCNLSINDVEDFLKGNKDFDLFHETLSGIDDEKVSNYVANNLELFYDLIK